MGAVYEVVHQGIGRRAAMKFLTLDTQAHPELAARFVNEARAANRISHPGVVQVYEFGQLEDGTPWMLMEFLEGETLSERLRALVRAGQVFGRDGLLLLHQLASVLNAAHAQGIVHREWFAPSTAPAPAFQY